MPPIIILDRLTQRFEDRTVVDALSFSIAEGQVFGFLGHDGAGMTTTPNMLTTLARPASGTAAIAGAGDPTAATCSAPSSALSIFLGPPG